MHLICKQVVVHTLDSEDIRDQDRVRAVLSCFKKQRMEISATLRRFGSSQRYKMIRILKVDEHTCDLVSADSDHTMTMRAVPFGDILEMAVTIRDPIAPDELETLSMDDIFDFESEMPTPDASSDDKEA